MEGGGGRRGVKIDFLTMSLCKKNIRRMMRVSETKDVTQFIFMPEANSRSSQV